MKASQRLALKRRAAAVFGRWPHSRPRRIILSYHAVESGPWSTSDRNFREQIAWLKSNARLRSLDNLLEASPTSDDLQVAVTFDDGYRSVLTGAAPLLEEAGASPTLFVSTSAIAERIRVVSDEAKGYYPREQFLLWDEVVELRARGWSIGSHGDGHPDLTQQTVQDVRDQMTRSRQILEERLAAPCAVFAYPFGRHNARVRAIAAECGYRWAIGSVHGTVDRHVDRYSVRRINIRNNYELHDFAGIIRGDWDYLRLLQTPRHTLRWFS